MRGSNFGGCFGKRRGKIPPYFNLEILINNLRICGSWLPINRRNKNAYIIWSVFILSSTLGHVIFVQTAFIFASGWDVDNEEVASAISFVINNYVHLFKVSVIFRNRKRIQHLLDYAVSKKFTCDDRETLKKLQRQFSSSAFLHYAIFQSVGFFACLGWISSSTLHSSKEKNDRTFPITAWYGYDATVSPLYEITLVIQSLALCICCLHNISLDGLIISFMAIIGCEFEILKTRIKEIGNDFVKNIDETEYPSSNILKEKYLDERLHEELKLCVEHHLAIIEYAKEFERIFHHAIFIQFLDNCCVLCMAAFGLSQLTEFHPTVILGKLFYMGAIVYQLFMYCYFGNAVSVQITLRNKIISMEINSHVKLSLGILIYVGVWPPVTRSYYIFIYIIYGLLCWLSTIGIYIFVQIVYLIKSWGDIEKMVAGSLLLIANGTCTFKVLVIMYRQDRIKKLLEILSVGIFSLYHIEFEDLSRSYASKGIFHYVTYQSIGAVALFCWGLLPVADFIAGNDRRLPIEGWYPYDTTITPAYEITCLHQTLSTIFACVENIGMDTLITGLINVASCQLEILKLKLNKIGEKPSGLSIPENDENKIHCDNRELNNCVEHHIAIIDFIREIEDIFGTIIAVQFSVNCLIICLTAFHITKIKLSLSAELIAITMYLCCMTYQIFIYSWHGNEIVLQSESVVFAAYAGNWWRCGERYKRGLRLLMVRANEPLTLKAGNLLTLSLETFVAILRASYSFFTVLQSSTDKTTA